MNIGEAVKERILALCNERDISINKLSSMSGVTQSTVNNIVSGRNRSATVSKIKKLCNGLGITIEDFFNSELFRDLEQEIQQKMWLRHFFNSLNIDVRSKPNLLLYFISRHCILSLQR